jgi:Kinesin motor domain
MFPCATGKTYTMQGGSSSSSSGVTPRALQHLFEGLAAKRNVNTSNASNGSTGSSSNNCDYTVSISYLQIYCEMLQDLLQPAEVDSPALRCVMNYAQQTFAVYLYFKPCQLCASKAQSPTCSRYLGALWRTWPISQCYMLLYTYTATCSIRCETLPVLNL